MNENKTNSTCCLCVVDGEFMGLLILNSIQTQEVNEPIVEPKTRIEMKTV